MKSLTNRISGVIALTGIGLLCSSAMAHHSYAMFDTDKTREADAVVRIFEFTNPHAMLWVYINDEQGKPILWGLEAPGPQQLLRNGWGKDSVKPGDRIKVTLNPLRSGKNGGNLVRLTLSDGSVLGAGGQDVSNAPAK